MMSQGKMAAMEWVVFCYNQHEENKKSLVKHISHCPIQSILLKCVWVVFYCKKATCGFPKSTQIYMLLQSFSFFMLIVMKY